MSDADRLRYARAVATVWRDAGLRYLSRDPAWSLCTHPLNMVLAALDGETDPDQLGCPPDELARLLRPSVEVAP